MTHLPVPLQPLAAYDQFMLYKTSPAANGKTNKFPCDLTGQVVNAHDTQYHMDAKTALAAAALFGPNYGTAFVFADTDPFYFVDLDNCLQADSNWTPTALDIMARLPGAAVEVSQSGKGLHIFGTGTLPAHGSKNIPLGLEMYHTGRFVALTGTNAVGSAAVDSSATLPALVVDYFTPSGGVTTEDTAWTTEPEAGWTPLTDEEIIKAASKTKSAGAAFSNELSTFDALWTADEAALSSRYPDENRAYDASSADAALVQILAFWTGKNGAHIFRLMKQSALVRDKWDREDYLTRTITRALSLQTQIYSIPERPKAVAAEPPEQALEAVNPLGNSALGVQFLTGYQFLGAEGQRDLFVNCVYVQDIHRVFTPRGVLLKADQFNATYGGYAFQMDDGPGGGKTTRKAWEAFTESQVVRYPKAEALSFRPDLPIGALSEQEGQIILNSYIPVITKRVVGDPAPFLTHLNKLLPDAQDRRIILSYMAAVVQHKGVKFQWAPLIQGTEGNGKTLLTRCVAFAVGERYTHFPPANELAEKFNDWLFDKLFIGIEDVYVPAHKSEIIEVLKPMLTNNRLAKRAMQQGQKMSTATANFMLNSNHKDAIRKTRNDRRFAVFYSAQQNETDLTRDGMDGAYFPDLYAWLNRDGYALVNEYLSTYPIPEELNPAGACHRAPITSSTQEVLTASLGGVEQEILEAIDEGRPGFSGGWVSSVAVERLLRHLRLERSISHTKRRELLHTLGYEWHPVLLQGRVNSPIAMDDNKKPRLYLKKGHPDLGISTAIGVAAAYIAAQKNMPMSDAEKAFK